MYWGRGTRSGNLGWSGGISHETVPLGGGSVFGTLGLRPTLGPLRPRGTKLPTSPAARASCRRLAQCWSSEPSLPGPLEAVVSVGVPWTFSSCRPLWRLGRGLPGQTLCPAPGLLHGGFKPQLVPSSARGVLMYCPPRAAPAQHRPHNPEPARISGVEALVLGFCAFSPSRWSWLSFLQ